MKTRGVLLALLIAIGVPLSAVTAQTPASGHASTAPLGPLATDIGLVLIGVPGWVWPEAAPPPSSLDPQVATLSIRRDSPGSARPLDGWATVASGSRYTAPRSMVDSAPPSGARVQIDAVATLSTTKPHLPAERTLGRIADAAHASGGCVTAGPGLGPAIAAADGAGVVDVVVSSNAGAIASSCRIAVIESSAQQVWVDAVAVGEARKVALIFGISDSGKQELHPIALTGLTNAQPRRAGHDSVDSLQSGTTHRAGYVQLVDVAPTVETMLGRKDRGLGDGATMAGVYGGPQWGALRSLATQAKQSYDATAWTAALLVIAGVVVFAFAGRKRYSVGLWFGAMPAATFAVGALPWRGLFEVPYVAVIAAAIAYLARTPRGVALATAGAIAWDVVLGARWQLDTPLGYSPLVAGRFAGLGNLAFGVFAAGVLIAMHRQSRAIGAGILFVALLVDGAPFFGADLGGTLALVPAGLLMLGVRGKRLIVAGAAAVALGVVFALVDLARPAAERTHLGRFAAKVRDGEGWDIIHRKVISAIDLVVYSPLTILALVVAIVALVFANLRAGDGPMVPLIRALSVAGVLAFLLNDSGLAAAITLVWVCVPLISAATRPPEVSRIRRRVLP